MRAAEALQIARKLVKHYEVFQSLNSVLETAAQAEAIAASAQREAQSAASALDVALRSQQAAEEQAAQILADARQRGDAYLDRVRADADDVIKRKADIVAALEARAAEIARANTQTEKDGAARRESLEHEIAATATRLATLKDEMAAVRKRLGALVN